MSNLEWMFYILIILLIIKLISYYRRIGRYEDDVRIVLNMSGHKNSFDWTTMKNFYDKGFSPVDAATEMINARTNHVNTLMRGQKHVN